MIHSNAKGSQSLSIVLNRSHKSKWLSFGFSKNQINFKNICSVSSKFSSTWFSEITFSLSEIYFSNIGNLWIIFSVDCFKKILLSNCYYMLTILTLYVTLVNNSLFLKDVLESTVIKEDLEMTVFPNGVEFFDSIDEIEVE